MTKLIRPVMAALVLGLMVLIAAWAVLAMYDLASIYADPDAPAVRTFDDFGGVIVIAVVLLVGLAAIAIALARGRLRRAIGVVGVIIVLATLIGTVVANQLGVEAKRADTSQPPRCGIGNAALTQQFHEMDHPGFFGGGTSSRTHCSYLLSVGDVPTALTEYERTLRAAGWSVAAGADRLTADRAGFRFRAVVKEPVRGDRYLTVSLTAES